MESQEQQKGTPLDAISNASRYSKVSKKTNRRTHFYWLGGGALAVIFVLLISSHHSRGSEKNKTMAMNNTNYSSSLNVNLERLRTLASQQPKSMTVHDTLENPFVKKQRSKEYLVRQNAPTSMYTATLPQTNRNQSNNNISQITFVGQGAKSQFPNPTTTAIEAKTILHPRFTIASGELFHAVLETAINSDLPGMVRAVVSKPVYSLTDERTIIPAGSRLVGQYGASILQGQNRVMIIWDRVVLPNGIVTQLNSPGTDRLGRAGQGADHVNTHFFARFGQATLLSLIGAGAATASVSENEQYNSAAAYRTAIAQSFQQSARQSLQDTLPMKPTIQLHQGANINVFVAHDLSFYQVLKDSDVLPHAIPSFVK